MGGFHRALASLGYECVFASEINQELRDLYVENFPLSRGRVFGDLCKTKSLVPAHDVLCAGFPCQPFSKSGAQDGFKDQTRGTLFHEILEVLDRRSPSYVILENVGNFERHDKGRTWRVVLACLEELGYEVNWAGHKQGGGHGLISPHHLGFPQHRERFFAVASRVGLPSDPFPPARVSLGTRLEQVVQRNADLTPEDRLETALTDQQTRCINHWNRLLRAIPKSQAIQTPLWGDESWETYPYENWTPWYLGTDQLRKSVGSRRIPENLSRPEALRTLPSYARSARRHFPKWKVDFIRANRAWWKANKRRVPKVWSTTLRGFPPSLRKVEWNCLGEERDLWRCVLQFRPSGLRAKRYVTCPALVAMTSTQIPILGPKRRFLTRIEGLRLQGFPESHRLPRSRSDAFAALGNAVHVGVARAVASRVLSSGQRTRQMQLEENPTGVARSGSGGRARAELLALSR
jgi:DNA (cytosine-5)-methyltransferase 1